MSNATTSQDALARAIASLGAIEVAPGRYAWPQPESDDAPMRYATATGPRCEAYVIGEFVHNWWPSRHQCTKASHTRGAHIEEAPNSVAGPHCLIWREGETPKVYWYPKERTA